MSSSSNKIQPTEEKRRPNSTGSYMSSSTADSDKADRSEKTQHKYSDDKSLRYVSESRHMPMEEIKKYMEPLKKEKFGGSRVIKTDHSIKSELLSSKYSLVNIKKYSLNAKRPGYPNEKIKFKHGRYSESPKLPSDKPNSKIMDEHPPLHCEHLRFSRPELDLAEFVYDKMKAEAFQGNCLLLESKLQQFVQNYNAGSGQSFTLAQTLRLLADSCNSVHAIERQFLHNQISLRFYAFRVEVFSLECLHWILMSMEKDRMTPSEKNVQNRIKEYFDIKVNMEHLLKRVGEDLALSKHKALPPRFILETMYDNTKNIFPTYIWPGHQYEPLDYISFDHHNEPLFKLAWGFLLAYYGNQLKLSDFKQGCVEESKIGHILSQSLQDTLQILKESEEESKQISGGKYGCACFLKYCGPKDVRKLSIGVLNSYVQKMLDIDLIRYDSTCLVLTYFEKHKVTSTSLSNCSNKEMGLSEIEHLKGKMSREYNANVVKLVREFKEDGVSLAQLPILVRQRYGSEIDVKYLGFAKLKDFILQNPKLEIWNRGPNYPHVRLKHKKDLPKRSNNSNRDLTLLNVNSDKQKEYDNYIDAKDTKDTRNTEIDKDKEKEKDTGIIIGNEREKEREKECDKSDLPNSKINSESSAVKHNLKLNPSSRSVNSLNQSLSSISRSSSKRSLESMEDSELEALKQQLTLVKNIIKMYLATITTAEVATNIGRIYGQSFSEKRIRDLIQNWMGDHFELRSENGLTYVVIKDHAEETRRKNMVEQVSTSYYKYAKSEGCYLSNKTSADISLSSVQESDSISRSHSEPIQENLEEDLAHNSASANNSLHSFNARDSNYRDPRDRRQYIQISDRTYSRLMEVREPKEKFNSFHSFNYDHYGYGDDQSAHYPEIAEIEEELHEPKQLKETHRMDHEFQPIEEEEELSRSNTFKDLKSNLHSLMEDKSLESTEFKSSIQCVQGDTM